MLGLIFRGIFIIGILTWYSTSVWKMIDNYFKDQFKSYLEEEYKKNPQMKSDIQRDTVGKVSPEVTKPPPSAETTVAPMWKNTKVPELKNSAVEVVENDAEFNRTKKVNEDEVTGGTSENEADKETTDKNAFVETALKSGLESRKLTDNDTHGEQPQRELIDHENRVDTKSSGIINDQTTTSIPGNTKKKALKHSKKTMAAKSTPKEKQTPKKRKVKTIVLTDKDFAAVKNQDVSDDDFWEFEDEEERRPLEGILVSELPFKPKADIGDLDRVTAEEYCPLTLDDESCGETYKWP